MKKTFCIVSAIIVILSAFCACGKSTKSEKNNLSTTLTTASTTAFTSGKEVATSAVEYKNETQVFHKDGAGNDLLLEHYNSDGKVEYYEEPVYSNDGSVDRIKYYDSKKKLVAASDNQNHFYDKDGKEISENDFIVLMNKANIIK
ncbi:MAG: hypothetical protein MJ147_07045 [Clostridia bacterium]|nr:hypothetical protein [Clostridia bacterium]